MFISPYAIISLPRKIQTYKHKLQTNYKNITNIFSKKPTLNYIKVGFLFDITKITIFKSIYITFYYHTRKIYIIFVMFVILSLIQMINNKLPFSTL